MSPLVFNTIEEIVEHHFAGQSMTAALEVGAAAQTLLSIPVIAASPRRVALNLSFSKVSDELRDTEMVIGNSNCMDFDDATFDCIVSSSALEHDKYFWRSIQEIRRVLKPGGYFIVGVPIYMTLPTDADHTTKTYARHGLAYNADFYRFSEQAVREVFFEDYSKVTDEVIVRREPNPYLVACGRK